MSNETLKGAIEDAISAIETQSDSYGYYQFRLQTVTKLRIELDKLNAPAPVPTNEPNLDDLPGWVTWIAQDEDGEWCGYEEEPAQAYRCWNIFGDSRYMTLLNDTPNPNWQTTKRRLK